jgi:Nucleotidyltransferase domain
MRWIPKLPACSKGLYLTGSVALGDFHPRTSDIDFVAVTATRPEGAAIPALTQVHDQLRRRPGRPFFDGIYVTWDDLRHNPGRAPLGDPVTWHTVAHRGIACRGLGGTGFVNESLRLRRLDYAGPNFLNIPAGVNDFLRARGEDRSLYSSPLARRRDALAFGRMVIADAKLLSLDRALLRASK